MIKASKAVSSVNSAAKSKINLLLERPRQVPKKKDHYRCLICNPNALTLRSLTDAVKQDVHLAVEYLITGIMIQPSFH